MNIKKCTEIYLKGSQEGEWAEANAIHNFFGIVSDYGIDVPFCINCGAKKMHGVNYTEDNKFEDNTAW